MKSESSAPIVWPYAFTRAIALLVLVACPVVTAAATATRVSSFEYDSATGLLKAEIVEPDDGRYCVRTEYGYADAGAGGRNLGNRTSATVSNCGATVPADAQFPTRVTAATQHAAYSVTVNGVAMSVPAGTFPTEVKNALGHAETRRNDPRFGGVVQETGPNALTTTRSFDGFGRVVLEVQPDGNRTVTRYCLLPAKVPETASNSAGCTTPASAPSLAVRYVEVEPQNPSSVKNGPRGRIYYDSLGREVRSETESFDGAGQNLGLVVKDTEYNDYGGVALVTQPYFLGSGSSLATATTAKGATETAYDALGRPTTVWTHDDEGSNSDTSPSGARSARISFDYDGLTVSEVHVRAWRNGSGAEVSRTELRTTKEKDAMGRDLRVTDAQGAQISYQYDAFGNLVKTRDPIGNETTAQFDRKGRRIELVDPNTGRYTYGYDALGQLKSQQNPNQRALSQATTMAYDLLGRMSTRSEAEFVTTWYYDKYADGAVCPKGIGKLCEVRTTHGVTRRLTYNNMGRPSTQQMVVTNGPTFNTSTSYDTNGRVVLQTWPSGEQMRYAYTSLGFLSEVRRPTGDQLVWQARRVNAWGKVEQFAYGNGVVTTVAHDPKKGWTEKIDAGLSTAPTGVMRHAYGYDTLGNVTDRTDHNGVGNGQAVTETFSYDGLNRLTFYQVAGAAVPGMVRKVSLQYNAIGSMLYKSDVGAYVYGTGGSARPHAVQNVAGVNYTYDANGNMVGASGGKYQTLGYTSFNLPNDTVGVLGRNGTRYTWVYGPDHERVKETKVSSAGTRTTFHLHPDKANGLSYEQETAENGTKTHRHYFAAGGVTVAVLTTTQVGADAHANPRFSYWHKDHLGSTAAITDAAGAVQERLAYDPFGKRRYADGRYDANGALVVDHPDGAEQASGANLHETDRGFTGHEHLDDVGVIHMNGRIYDPLIGRFMQPDPQLQQVDNLQNFNRYSYVLNNPLRYTDPTGEAWQALPFMVKYFLATTAMVVASEAISNPELRAVVAIAAAALMGPGSNYAVFSGTGAGVANTAYAGFSSGMIASGGDPEAGLKGALKSIVFYGVGQATNGWGNGGDAYVGRVAAHAVAGCAIAAAEGGKCRHGAISAAISKAITPVTGEMDIASGVVISAIAGGVGSKLIGGKFSQGAVTSAFGYLFNECSDGSCINEHTGRVSDCGGLCTPEMEWGNSYGTDAGDEVGIEVMKGFALGVSSFATGGTMLLAVEARALGVSVRYLQSVRTGLLSEPTGRVAAVNAAEAVAMSQARNGAGRVIIPAGKVTDPRLQGAAWEKVHHSATIDNVKGVVHYLRERVTGIVQDFKFKDLR